MKSRFFILCSAVLAAIVFASCNSSASSSDLDRQFIDMMVPHHQGAVEMAKVAQVRADHPEIKQMANAVIQSQNTEIGQMKGWRKAWYGSDQTPAMDKMPMMPGAPTEGHGHSGNTMNMAADVEMLRRSPEPFDKAFIDMMIPHHQSAIDAAKVVESKTQRAEVRDLAKAIIADQQREIGQMKQWRMAW